MSEKKLKRSAKDKKVAGVLAGVAKYFGWEVTMLRIIYLLASLFTAGFPGIILYLACCLLMPVEGGES